MWDRDLIYKGHKILPYCPRCGTPLSSHEVAQGYRDAVDPSVFVRMKLKGDPDTSFLVWTTTPWTLISNVALAVAPTESYVKVRSGGENLILAEALLSVLDEEHEVLESYMGLDLIGTEYEPLYTFVPVDKKAWYVIGGDFVTLEDGTGIVHTAPAFGEDDYRVGVEHDLPFVQPVDGTGSFTADVKPWAGMFIKDADPLITEDLDKRGLVVRADDAVQERDDREQRQDQVAPQGDRRQQARRLAREQRRLGRFARPLLGHAAEHLDLREVRAAGRHRQYRGAP